MRGCRFNASPPSRPIAIRELRYRDNTLLPILASLLFGHVAKQAEIFSADCDGPTTWPKITSLAILVQYRFWYVPR